MKPFNLYFTTFLLFTLTLEWVQVQQVNAKRSDKTIPYHVGVILDYSSSMGQMANTCISMGISDFYTKFNNYKTRLVLHNKDSMGDPLQAFSQAIDLLQNYHVQAIIGPQTSNEAEFLVNLGVKAEVPIISFSATSPLLSHAKTSYFVRVANSDNSQIKTVCALIQAFRWREVVLMYEDSIYGYGIIPDLISALDEIQARVPYRSVISPLATDNEIVIELYKLMAMSTRVFLVHMSPALAYRVFSKLNDLDMMSKGYAWIGTDGITSLFSSMNSSAIASMQGLVGVRPYLPPSRELNNFFTRWRSILQKGNQSIKINDLNRRCLWAYDAIWALARSTEKLGNKASENSMNFSMNVANLSSIPVSETGSQLVKVILESKFNGLSGFVELKDGEMKPQAFEIINIVGRNIKVIGFWTPENGISKVLSLSNNKTGLDFSASLSPVWPGGSVQNPRGWVIPVSGKKLRIGVPLRDGFTELVEVKRDDQTNRYHIDGFCIDVFRAAVESLPYAVPYELIPYVNPDGTRAGTYSDLVYQVYLKKFDAAVGDFTITSNRSLYVDFTLPFTEGGTAVVFPALTNRCRTMWVFLEPFQTGLWLVILGFFISTGIIVWAIEHQPTNNELKGPLLLQIEKIFSHSVSSLLFAPGGNLTRSFSKFVVIVWLFAAFILISSYTASLSSWLTARQISQFPKGGRVGFRALSVVAHFNNLNFEGMRNLTSDKDFVEQLSEGSEHGGVSGILDEIPYIKLFLAKHPDGYKMFNETHGSSGFGFVFPRGSPLVPDLSGEIVKLRESGRLKLIEKAWFGYNTSFITEASTPDYIALEAYNFRGLFIIMGITLIVAFVMSHFFMESTNAKKSDAEQAEVKSNGVEEPILPVDNIQLSSLISNHSSGDISVGDGNVTSSEDQVNETDHSIPLPTEKISVTTILAASSPLQSWHSYQKMQLIHNVCIRKLMMRQ